MQGPSRPHVARSTIGFFLFFFMLAGLGIARAELVSSVQDGDWADPATWDLRVPRSGDDVIVDHTVTVLRSGAVATDVDVSGNLVVKTGGSIDADIDTANSGVVHVEGGTVTGSVAALDSGRFNLLDGEVNVVSGTHVINVSGGAITGGFSPLGATTLEGSAADIDVPIFLSNSNTALVVRPTANGESGLSPIRSENLSSSFIGSLELDTSLYIPQTGDSWDILVTESNLPLVLENLVAPDGVTLEADVSVPGSLTLRVTNVDPIVVNASDDIYEDGVRLSWAATEAAQTYFEIYRTDPSQNREFLSVAASTEREYFDTTGDPGVEYTYEVILFSAAGEGGIAGSDTDTGRRIIFAPIDASATDGDKVDAVEVSWLDLSTIESGFNIYRKVAGAPDNTFALVGSTSQNDTFYSDATAEAGTAYNYCVSAIDVQGFESDVSCDDGERGFVLAPGSVNASDGQYVDEVRVTWQDLADDEVEYRIYRDAVLVETLPANSTSYSDTDDLGTPHTYCVASVREVLVGDVPTLVESQLSCDDGIGGPQTLAAPLTLYATFDEYDDQVLLRWDDTANEDTYEILRDSEVIAEVSAGTVEFSDGDAVAGTIHTYCVRARSESGGASTDICADGRRIAILSPTSVEATDGDLEDAVTVTWESEATSVVLFNVKLDGITQITVAGDVRSATVAKGLVLPNGFDAEFCVTAVTALGVESEAACDTGFRNFRAPTDVTATDDAFEQKVVIEWTDQTEVEAGYRISRREEGDANDPVEVGTTTANTEFFNDVTGEPGVTYEYFVSAMYGFNQSSFFDSESGMDTGSRFLIAPTDLTASQGDFEDRIQLRWTNNSLSETGYLVRRGGTSVATVGANVTSYEDIGAFEGEQAYSVVAIDDFGESEASFATGYTQIQAPGSVRATDIYDDRVVIVWTDESDIETNYRIYRDDALIATVNAGVTTYEDTPPSANVDYKYCVEAFRASPVASSDLVCADGSMKTPDTGLGEDGVLVERFSAGDGATRGDFGHRIGVGEGFAVVGAPEDDGAGSGRGAIYLYVKGIEGWDYVDKYTVAATNSAHFGETIGVDGNFIIAGAPFDDTDGLDAGSAWVFEFTGSELLQRARLSRPTPAAGDRYGATVAMGENFAAVGSSVAAVADVHLRSTTTGNWSFGQSLTISGGSSSLFAASMDIAGSYLYVGAPLSSLGGRFRQGSVYVYDAGNSFLLRSEIRGDSDEAFLGVKISAASQDRATFEGADQTFHVYEQFESGFRETGRVRSNGTGNYQQIAYEDGVILAAYEDGSDGGVRVFLEDFSGWTESKTLRSDLSGIRFGSSVAIGDEVAFFGGPSTGEATGYVYYVDIPNRPTQLTATDGDQDAAVRLEWDDNSERENGYTVFRDGNAIATTGPNVTTYNDGDSQPGQVHDYAVAAFQDVVGRTASRQDFGWQTADGVISGRISTRAGASIEGAVVCLDPPPNKALLLDGVEGHALVADGFISNNVSAGSGLREMTLEFWLNATSLGDGTIFSVRENGGFNPDLDYFTLEGNGSGGLRLWIRNDAVISTPSLDLENDWTHIAVTWLSATGDVQFYRNGSLFATGNGADGAALGGNGKFVFGQNLQEFSGGFVRPFQGALDEFRIWDSVRDISAIQETADQVLTGDEVGLLTYFPFDEGLGRAAGNLTGGPAASLEDGAFWAEDGAPLMVCAETDLEGNYSIAGLRYGESSTYEVIPTFGSHVFDPAFTLISLDREQPVQNEVEFLDITSYAVSGTINFENTGCFPENVTIFVDGVLGGVTDSDGRFVVSAAPGTRVIEPRVEGRVFSPATVELEIESDTAGIDFRDTTLRFLSGRVGGGCDFSIGDVVLEIVSEDGCYGPIQFTTDGEYDLLLPPQSYFMQVVDVSNVPGALDRATILDYFEVFGPQTVDLTDEDLEQNFIYRAPLSVEVTGFPTGSCEGEIITDPVSGVSFPAVPILAQGPTPIELTISVFENYGNGNLCPVDSGVVAVFDEIQDIADAAQEISIVDGAATYHTIANTPNTTVGRVDSEGNDRSFQKPVSFVVTVDGTTVTRTKWALVTGDRPRTGTFVSATSEEFPLLILRDPPGDNSYAYIEEGRTVTSTISNAGLISQETGVKVEVDSGLEFRAGTGFLNSKNSFEVSNDFGFLIELATNLNGETTISTTTTETFSTSDDEVFAGKNGDVYMGIALNFLFAKADVIDVDPDACIIQRSQSIRYGAEEDNSFDTVFLYTDTHIRDTLIPTLGSLAELAETQGDDQAEIFASAAESWQDYLDYNETLISDVDFGENRSFAAGANYATETTSDTTSVNEYSVGLTSTNEVAAGFGFKVAGSGAEGQFVSTMVFGYEHSESDEEGNYVTVGYELADDDVGDFFSVDIGVDSRYGTPVFETVSGRSSCPWEVNTQPRDSLALFIEPPVRTDVPQNELASFTITLENLSPSEELREYWLYPVQSSNPGGATLRINGNTFGRGQPFFIDPGVGQEVTLTVERGPRRFIYEDLQIMAFAPCEFERFQNGGPLQLMDIVSFDVEFAAPCTDISLFEPDPGWAFNIESDAQTGSLLSVTLNDFEIEIGEGEQIEAVGAEYRLADTDDWFPIEGEILVDDVPVFEDGPNEGEPMSVQILWDVSLIPDGVYEVRAFARCEAGKTTSLPATGRIDRQEPETFGAPQPADLVLALGDEISITFNEEIDCETVTTQTLQVEVDNPDGDNTPVIFEASCDGRTIIITPTGPSLSVLEGQTMIVRAGLLEPLTGSTIEDLAGNPMVSQSGTDVETWSFEIRQNDFTWTEGKIFADAAFRIGGSTTGELVNGTDEDLSFDIEDLPEWLTATPLSGTLSSGESEFVSFVVADSLSEGTYEVVVNAVVDDQIGNPIIVSPLTIQVDVTCQPPTWSVEAANFEYNMTAIVELEIEGFVTDDPSDLLAAFVGNEVRGVGSPQSVLVDGQEEWRVFMNIFSNRAEGENVRFRVFDASDCRVYGSTDRFFRFDESDRRGTPQDPEYLVATDLPDLNTQIIPVNEGWTWFSLNLDQQDMSVISVLADLNPSQGDVIKSQTTDLMAEFDEATGWNGSLETLNFREAYALYVSEAGNIIHSGTPVSETSTIPIVDGWNWVGYPRENAQEINTALSLSSPANGDAFKGQLGFAEYAATDTDPAWIGDLTTIEPGRGYKLFVEDRLSFGAGSLVYASSSQPGPTLLAGGEWDGTATGSADLLPDSPVAMESFRFRIAEETRQHEATLAAARSEFGENWPDWNRQTGYQFAMSMVALVEVDGERNARRGARLGAFVDGELRGVADLVYAPALDQYAAFLMVQTNEPEGETVEFRYYDPNSDQVFEIGETMVVDIDARPGDLEAPFVFRTSGPIDTNPVVPLSFSLDQHYPNPAPSGMAVTLRWAQPVSERVVIEVFDIQGRLVRTAVDETLEPGWHNREFETSSMSSGLYFYRMRAGDFGAVQKLLLVK